MNETKPAVVVKEELKEVAMELVRRDPAQPRKEFDAGKLQELADSIASLGLQQRPAVRWIGPWKILEPDMIETDWRIVDEAGTIVQRELQENLAHMVVNSAGRQEGYYQLIFGERRKRACELLGWKTLPVVVKELADGQGVGTMQLVENMQRENLSALEEAEGIRLKLQTSNLKPEELAKELGISRATLFGRLALLKISAPVRAALVAGRINTSVAQVVALVPEEKAQVKLLEEVAGSPDPEGKWDGPAPVREVQEKIEDEYCKGLKEAPFDKEDAELLPVQYEVSDGNATIVVDQGPPAVSLTAELRAHVATNTEDDGLGHKKTVRGVWTGEVAGTMGGQTCLADGLKNVDAEWLKDVINRGNAGLLRWERVKGGKCGDCPFRSGNIPGFAEAAKRPNLCTRPGCYGEKMKAHWVQLAGEKVKKGETVLEAKVYRQMKKEYVEGDRQCQNCDGWGTWEKLMGKHKPKGTLATTERGLVTVYPVAEAKAAVRKNGHKFYAESQPMTKEDREKAAAKEEAKKERLEARAKLVMELAPKALAALEALTDKRAWELVAQTLASELHSRFECLNPKQERAAALLLCLDDPTDWQGEWAKAAVAQWKELGIDLVAEEKKREKEQEKTEGTEKESSKHWGLYKHQGRKNKGKK